MRIDFKIIAITAIAFMSFPVIAASDTEVLNLKDVIRKAIENNPSLHLEKDSKLLFFVSNPSENPETDIFTKKLIAGAELRHEIYGRVKIWLHYPEVNEANARIFPESLPSLIIIETPQGTKTINLKKKGAIEDFYGLWKEFITPNRLTFIENCVYGF